MINYLIYNIKFYLLIKMYAISTCNRFDCLKLDVSSDRSNHSISKHLRIVSSHDKHDKDVRCDCSQLFNFEFSDKYNYEIRDNRISRREMNIYMTCRDKCLNEMTDEESAAWMQKFCVDVEDDIGQCNGFFEYCFESIHTYFGDAENHIHDFVIMRNCPELYPLF